MTDSAPPAPPRRKRSARFVEVAALAGVSLATVNRVLNERGSVAPATRARVIAAARSLALPRTLPDARHGLTRFDVVLSDSATPYFERLWQALRHTAQTLAPRVLLHLHRVPPGDDAACRAALAPPAHRRDGLLVALPDHDSVRQALRQQREAGVPVVTLMSAVADVPGLHYAGIHNLQAGRTAGHFIGRIARQPGGVLLITHHLGFRAHAERIQGCTQVLAERFAHLQVSAPVQALDDADQAHFALRHALDQARRGLAPPLRGLYTSGAGTSGVASVLHRLPADERPVWVGHELHDSHRDWLRQGLLELVIDQDPEGQVQAAVHHLLHATGHVHSPARTAPIEFRLFCAEHLGG